jgi:alpha-beta hydrolase superfamily lysophospholipase
MAKRGCTYFGILLNNKYREAMMKAAISILVLSACLLGSAGWAASDRDITVANSGATLHGSLLMPDRQGDVPAVLMIAGSGPTDRDGNSTILGVKPATLKLLAEGLAESGIASLRFDKRGIAASASAMSKEADLRFTTYVDDAVAWAEFLKSQPHVRCVYILGHSEGALIGALAAARSKVCGYISISGAGFPADEILLRQMKEHGLPAPLLQSANDIVARLKQGETVADVPPQLAAIFRPGIQPYLISWFAIDPAVAIAAIPAPVLLLQGTTDIQVSVADAQRLAKAVPRAKLLLLDGVNHILKPAPADPQANFATYGDPALPLAPKVVPAITAFVRTSP